MKMDRSVLEKKSYIKMLGFNYFSKLNKGSYIISVAKTASKKIGALICSMKFLSNEVGLFLFYRYNFGRCLSELAQLV